MATWVQVVGGLALLITGGGVVLKFVRSFGRVVSVVDEFWPLVAGDPTATPRVPPLKDRLNSMDSRTEAAYTEARAAKEASVAALQAVRRMGGDL